MIALQKKGGVHVLEDLDYYTPITLQSTDLNILSWALRNSLQIVAGYLIETE